MNQTHVLDVLKKAFPLRRFTVSEYHRMIDAGILYEGERAELIDGVIIQQMPQKSTHSAVINQMTRQFYQLVPKEEALLRVQTPIILTNNTEPEPDLAMVKPRVDVYVKAHPSSADVLLLVEVSDTTLEYDQEIKLPRYAASGIPDVWIVNLVDDRIEVYRDPITLPDGMDIYQTRTDLVKGDTLISHALPSLKIAVDEILIS
jgi:Uma2 family endonuclease